MKVRITTREVSWNMAATGATKEPIKWQSSAEFDGQHIYGDPKSTSDEALDSLRIACEKMIITARLAMGVIKETQKS